MFGTVGVIGSEPLGEAAARRVVAAGLRVRSANTRGPTSPAGLVNKLGPNAFAVTQTARLISAGTSCTCCPLRITRVALS